MTYPLTFFQNILRVLSSVRHFFSVARHTPLTLFQKILRVLSSVRHFFSVAHDTPLTFFHKILRVLSSDRHFFSVARDTIKACAALHLLTESPPPFLRLLLSDSLHGMTRLSRMSWCALEALLELFWC